MPGIDQPGTRSAASVRVSDLIQRWEAARREQCFRIPAALFESQYHITPFTADGGGGDLVSVTPPAHDDRADAARYVSIRDRSASMVVLDDPILERPYYEQLAAMRGLSREHSRLVRVPLRPRSGALESLTLSAEELRGLAAKTPAQLKSWAVDMANRTTRQQPF